MRNVFKEYRQGLISWDEAYAIANNKAASTTKTEYWARQMESLAVDVAQVLMSKLGYVENSDGKYFKGRL